MLNYEASLEEAEAVFGGCAADGCAPWLIEEISNLFQKFLIGVQNCATIQGFAHRSGVRKTGSSWACLVFKNIQPISVGVCGEPVTC